MIVLIDNYDSFTFNLAHLLRASGEEVRTFRCDKINVRDILDQNPRRIVISPGPGRPGDRGIAVELVQRAAGQVPLLGVCLGHQAIAVAFGGGLVRSPRLVHGKTSLVKHDGKGLFHDAPDTIKVMRYHSLVVDAATLPEELEVSAWLDDGTIMGLRHKTASIAGIQFHPESFLTPEGPAQVNAFLKGTEAAVL